MSFEDGDKVRVHKPEDTDEGPGWNQEMDEYDNTVQRVISTSCSGNVKLYGISYGFRSSWLTLIEDDSEENVEEDEDVEENEVEEDDNDSFDDEEDDEEDDDEDFNSGDRVRVRKPENENVGPTWVKDMDEYDDTVQTVENVYCSGYIGLEGVPYSFSPKWLTRVADSEDKVEEETKETEKRKFNRGDRVKVSKPKNIFEGPTWHENMDKYDQTVQTFKGLDEEGFVDLEEVSNWVFDLRWLTLVEDDSEENVEEASSTSSQNYHFISKNAGKVDLARIVEENKEALVCTTVTKCYDENEEPFYVGLVLVTEKGRKLALKIYYPFGGADYRTWQLDKYGSLNMNGSTNVCVLGHKEQNKEESLLKNILEKRAQEFINFIKDTSHKFQAETQVKAYSI